MRLDDKASSAKLGREVPCLEGGQFARCTFSNCVSIASQNGPTSFSLPKVIIRNLENPWLYFTLLLPSLQPRPSLVITWELWQWSSSSIPRRRIHISFPILIFSFCGCWRYAAYCLRNKCCPLLDFVLVKIVWSINTSSMILYRDTRMMDLPEILL